MENITTQNKCTECHKKDQQIAGEKLKSYGKMIAGAAAGIFLCLGVPAIAKGCTNTDINRDAQPNCINVGEILQ